jgi:hypothetical protein
MGTAESGYKAGTSNTPKVGSTLVSTSPLDVSLDKFVRSKPPSIVDN